MALAGLLSGIGNFSGSLKRSWWTAYQLLLVPSSHHPPPTAMRINSRRIRAIDKGNWNNKSRLQYSGRHHNRKSDVRFYLRLSLTHRLHSGPRIRTPLRCDSPPGTNMQNPPSGSGSLASPNLRPHSPDVGLFHGYDSSSVPSRCEILTDDEFLLDRDAVPHTVSNRPPDQEAPPAQNSPPPPARRSQREKRPPATLGDYVRY